jgi:hypothetical protein
MTWKRAWRHQKAGSVCKVKFTATVQLLSPRRLPYVFINRIQIKYFVACFLLKTVQKTERESVFGRKILLKFLYFFSSISLKSNIIIWTEKLLFGYTVRISAFCENCSKTVQTLVYISLPFPVFMLLPEIVTIFQNFHAFLYIFNKSCTIFWCRDNS